MTLRMKITLNRNFQPKEITAHSLTFQVGDVMIEIVPGRSAGRPSLKIRSVQGPIAINPEASNTVHIVAYSDLETHEQAVADRKASEAVDGEEQRR